MTNATDAPTFSVVVPAFDAERTIALTVRSVLAQSRRDLELIVVDNGSADATAEQVETFLPDYRVRLVREETPGPAAARNAGLAVARGRYVSFLDADDVFLPDYLATMVTTLESAGADVAYTDGWEFDEATGRLLRRSAMSPWTPRTPPTAPEEVFETLLIGGNYLLPSVLLQRDLVTGVGGFRVDLKGTEDWELWLRLAQAGSRFVPSPRKLVVKRRRVGQLSANASQMRDAAIAVYRIVADEYDVADELRDQARRRARELDHVAAAPPARSGRPVPRWLRGPYRLAWLVRWFRLRPPAEVRPLYRELRRNSRAVAATSASTRRPRADSTAT